MASRGCYVVWTDGAPGIRVLACTRISKLGLMWHKEPDKKRIRLYETSKASIAAEIQKIIDMGATPGTWQGLKGWLGRPWTVARALAKLLRLRAKVERHHSRRRH